MCQVLEFIDDFIVEDLGIHEEDVYDIEVEDNHNFFGNGILVHNSCYFSFKKVIDQVFNGKEVQDNEKLDWLCKFSDGPLQKIVKAANTVSSRKLNAFESERFGADREAISRRGVFYKKKMYALSLSDMEGVRYDPPKLKVTGLSAKKSSTPLFFRKKLTEFFEIFLIEGNIDKSIDHISNVENEFKNSKPEDVAGNFNAKDVKSGIDPNGKNGVKKGCHIIARAAIISNRLVSENEKARKEVEEIRSGDKVKVLALRLPNAANSDIIAWKDEWPEFYSEIGLHESIDWNRQFEKSFKKPIANILEVAGINPDVSEDLDIF